MPKKKEEDETSWNIFEVRYQNPKFGTENHEFLPDVRTFTVSTTKGPMDAKEACLKYHPNCRVVIVLDKLAAITDRDGSLTKQALLKLEKTK